MCRMYSLLRLLGRRWILVALILVAVTTLLGLWGLSEERPEFNLDTDFYHVIKMFVLNTSVTDENAGWKLNAARWMGMVVWSFTILTFLIGIFYQRAVTAYVAICTFFRRGHVVLAGLGTPEDSRERLVKELRAAGKDVVVLEPDPHHPGLDACRNAGAICLTGSPLEVTDLKRAKLTRADSLLVLGSSDRENVALLATAAMLLGPQGPPTEAEAEAEEDTLAPTPPDKVSCVVQVGEPGLLEVIRQHHIQKDAVDRLHLRVFNTHEMVARAMLRECLTGPDRALPKRILLVGTGREGRLGEALVGRAAKDRWIERTEKIQGAFEPLLIDVIDRDAERWSQCVSGRYQFLREVCGLNPIEQWATKCGFDGPNSLKDMDPSDYDAVFICLADEAYAVMQAANARRVFPERIPIIVRVREEKVAFGKLLGENDAGGLGKNIRVVGTHDRIFSVAQSMNPAVEMLAQVLHQDYLALTQQKIRDAEVRGDHETARKIAGKKAFVGWNQLPADLQQSNRMLAQRLPEYQKILGTDGRLVRSYTRQFTPRELINPTESYVLSDEEVAKLAEREHEMWCKAMKSLGWRKGQGQSPHDSDPDRKLNPNLVDWTELDPGMKDYDRSIIRRLPYVFAKADEKLVRE